MFFIIMVNVQNSYSQKNNLNTTAFLYKGNGIYGGNMVGSGLDLNYSREIFNKFRLNVGFGKGSFSGTNSTQFELEDDEKGFLPLTRWNFGLDYSFFRSSKLDLSAGLDFLNSRFPFVESLQTGGSDDLTFRQIGISNTQNVMIHVKMENKVGPKTFWTTQFSYQPYFIDNLEVIMLKTGIGYRF